MKGEKELQHTDIAYNMLLKLFNKKALENRVLSMWPCVLEAIY